MADPEQAKRVVEAMLLTALADGEVQGKEALFITKVVKSHPELAGVQGLGTIIPDLRARLGHSDLEAVTAEIASGITLAGYRELAFRCCAQVMGADANIEAEEATILDALQSAFGFTGEQVRALLAAK